MLSVQYHYYTVIFSALIGKCYMYNATIFDHLLYYIDCVYIPGINEGYNFHVIIVKINQGVNHIIIATCSFYYTHTHQN